MPLIVRRERPDYKEEPVEWPAVKKAIIDKLNVVDEYESMGVRFSSPFTRSNGIRPCYAIDRPPGSENPDDEASAFVNVLTGYYFDKGGNQKGCGFFDFAAKHGRFGSWIEALRHYADKADVEIGRVERSSQGNILEDRYVYRGAAGEVSYATFRYRKPNGKKTFRQYPFREGTWLRGVERPMDGVEPLPFYLPELIAAPDDEVVLVLEGEKDVRRAWAIGHPATTNHEGAGAARHTWAKFAHMMPERDYCLIADNDQAGKEHMLEVAECLKERARSIRIMVLPDVPNGGDLSDWLDMGNSPDLLQPLLVEAPEWAPGVGMEIYRPKGVDRPCRLATAADLIEIGQRTSWLWEGWIPKGVLTLLAAEPNTGKTRFCLDLAKRINLGMPWPDGSPSLLPRGGKTLWIAADNQHSELADNAIAYGFDPWSLILNAPPEDIFGGTDLSRPEHLATLEFNIRDVQPAVVFIDTITNTSEHKSQDSADAKRQYKPLQEIAKRTGVPIVCVTHLNANGKVLGRRANEKTRVTIAMSQPDPDDLRLRIQVTLTRLTLKPKPLGVSMSDSGNEYDTHPPEPVEIDEQDARRGRGRPARDNSKAVGWLAGYLRGERRWAFEVLRAAADAKIIPDPDNARPLYKALEAIGGRLEEDEGKKWFSPATSVNGFH